MPGPLDHVTVIQQINFAEWAHHDLQVHPERTMLKARDINSSNRADSRRKPNATDNPARPAMRFHGQNYHLSSYLSGGRVDIKA